MPPAENPQDSVPGELFDSTQWSMVIQAGGDSPEAEKALEKLCRLYWPPLYAFARRHGLDQHTAQDAVQGFLARLLARRDIAAADRERGRFRSFLVGSFKNHLVSQARADGAQKRGGGAQTIDIELAAAEGLCAPELSESLSPDRAFDRVWARALMARALARLAAEHATPQAGPPFLRAGTRRWGTGVELENSRSARPRNFATNLGGTCRRAANATAAGPPGHII